MSSPNASAIATLILSSTTVTISGSLTATNIYTKTEVDNLLTPKAATTYVDGSATIEGQPSNHIPKN